MAGVCTTLAVGSSSGAGPFLRGLPETLLILVISSMPDSISLKCLSRVDHGPLRYS